LAESDNWDKYNELLDLYAKDKVDEIVVLDENMYKFLKTKGYNVSHFINPVIIKEKENYKKIINNKDEQKTIKIGLYNAEDKWNKNIYNQLSAVSLIENHELNCSPINYKISMMARKHNINIGTTSVSSREDLYKKMANNDLNLFISYPEFPTKCPVESMELGTLCLVGKYNQYFTGTKLEEYLVVNNENNINEIIEKINNALKNKDKVFELYKEWKKEYDIRANESISNILRDKEGESNN